jgi:hypothetical protein
MDLYHGDKRGKIFGPRLAASEQDKARHAIGAHNRLETGARRVQNIFRFQDF